MGMNNRFSLKSKNLATKGIYLGIIQIMLKKGLKNCRFLKYNVMRKHNKTYVIVYIKPCNPSYSKSENSKSFASHINLNTLKKTSFKRLKKLSSSLKNYSNTCKLHSYYIRKKKIFLRHHCFSNKLIKQKLLLIKSFISRILSISFTSIRLVHKSFSKSLSNAFLQGVRLKEQLMYTNFSFKK